MCKFYEWVPESDSERYPNPWILRLVSLFLDPYIVSAGAQHHTLGFNSVYISQLPRLCPRAGTFAKSLRGHSIFLLDGLLVDNSGY